jgi:hypothetical protein
LIILIVLDEEYSYEALHYAVFFNLPSLHLSSVYGHRQVVSILLKLLHRKSKVIYRV